MAPECVRVYFHTNELRLLASESKSIETFPGFAGFLGEKWVFQNYLHLETVAQNLLLINDYVKTISSHFFGSYINIFHEKEIQTVILRG